MDRVLQAVKIRQCVLSLPMPVRLLHKFKPQAVTAVVREFTRAVFAYPNFCPTHGTFSVSATMQAGIAGHPWSIVVLVLRAQGQVGEAA